MPSPQIAGAVVVWALALSGCAAQSGWSPTVDPYGDPHTERLQLDKAECRELALRAAGDQTGETVRGGLLGGALGAGTGAAIGAVTGDAGKGAAIGATAGGIGGGTHQAIQSSAEYKQAFRRCMRNRGHKVLN